MVTSIALEDAGYHVTVAADGQAGLQIALQDHPELIVSDYMMPKMDGLEMVARLRAEGVTTPVVLTTSIPEEQLPLKTGYDAYLPKPYFEEGLLAVLEQFSQSPGRK